MEIQLPKVRIFDTDFLIDRKNHEFRQVDNVDNRIPFRHTIDNDNHISLIYEKKSKNVYTGNWWNVTHDDDIHMVNLPPLGVLDNIALDSGRQELHHYGQWLEAWDVDGEHKGYNALPVAPIDGVQFSVDLNMKELRERGWPYNAIHFSELQVVTDHFIELFYDPKTRNQFRGSREEFQSRPEVKHAIFPSPLTLDRLTIADSIKKWIVKMAKQQVRQGKNEKPEKQSPQQKKPKGRNFRM